jgi:hypothetical protein
MLEITFHAAKLPKSGALAVLIGEGDAPAGLWQEIDTGGGGQIGRAFAAASFKGGSRSSRCLRIRAGGRAGGGFARA